jgi:Ca2+-binding EF-hand superfamily protein
MDAAGFENSAEAVMKVGNIEPWPARAMIQERLETQARLARVSPLKTIPVQDGFQHFTNHIGRLSGLKKEDFLKVSKNLVEIHKIKHKPDEIKLLEEVFDSMDYDKSNDLTVGEWASGLAVFFKGAQDEKSSALFQLLDRDSNGSISKSEMKEYCAPLVKAMTPLEALALRPMLVAHATDKIFEQVDLNHDDKCSSSEFVKWRQNHDIVNELVAVIEGEVYKLWVSSK